MMCREDTLCVSEYIGPGSESDRFSVKLRVEKRAHTNSFLLCDSLNLMLDVLSMSV